MRARTVRTQKVERPKAPAKPPRMGKGALSATPEGKDLRLTTLLEEWLAEARIRYTHAGD